MIDINIYEKVLYIISSTHICIFTSLSSEIIKINHLIYIWE